MSVPLMHLMPQLQSLCISSIDGGGIMFAMLLAAIAGYEAGFGAGALAGAGNLIVIGTLIWLTQSPARAVQPVDQHLQAARGS